jgi:hypothetical protein
MALYFKMVFKNCNSSLAWWHIACNLSTESKQEDLKFKASLNYIRRPCFKKKKNKKTYIQNQKK